MKNKQYRLIVAAALLLFAVTGSKAQQAQSVSAPRTLSYQGILTSTGTPGNILGANRLLTVTLYGDANGTIKLWQSTMNTPIDSNGVFNCTLGTADNPLPQPSVMDRAIWLGVAVDNGTELRPLSQVTASAYAINVADSAITSQKIATGAVGTQNLADGSITTSKLADSSITSEKMNMNYVSSISVNGQPITGAGTNLNIVSGDGVNATWIPDESTLTLSGTGGASDGTTMSILTEWQLLGNTGISVPLNFVGTKDSSSALEIHLKDMSGGTATPNIVRIAHYQYDGSSPSITMGYGSGSLTGNIIGDAATSPSSVRFHGSTIAGGGAAGLVNTISGRGDFDFIGSGVANTIKSAYSSLTGGDSNYVDTIVDFSYIGGGLKNKIGWYGYSEEQLQQPMGDTTYLGGDFIGAGTSDTVKTALASIVGGAFNLIDTFASYSFIGGGQGNFITNPPETPSFSAIVAGGGNIVADEGSIIGAGNKNVITQTDAGIISGIYNQDSAEEAFIGAGEHNIITSNGGSSFIGSGANNFANSGGVFIGSGVSNTVYAYSSGVASGENATIHGGSSNSFVGGGYYNSIDTLSPYSVIGGGTLDVIGSSYSTIAGGDSNHIDISSDNSFIGGGSYNYEGGAGDAIAGGTSNHLPDSTYYSFIGGGLNNFAGGEWDVIAGGDSNIIDAPQPEFPVQYDSILGGYGNHIELIDEHFDPPIHENATYFSAIAGGYLNNTQEEASFVGGGVQNNSLEEFSAVLGGDSNSVEAPSGVIGGGNFNAVTPNANSSGVFSGNRNNVFAATLAVIGGGDSNAITTISESLNAMNSFIGGGHKNQIVASSEATIAGGDTNKIDILDPFATIGGGQQNWIEPNNGPDATIPGGDSLIANSFAQTVVGYHNRVTGTVAQGTPHALIDTPLFIVGNGDNASSRSNAFEVSYDGHTTVHQTNGDSPTNAPIQGSTYTDNIVYAWGNVTLTGALRLGLVSETSQSFGIGGAVAHALGTGIYLVNIIIRDPSGNVVPLDGAAMTVTLIDDGIATDCAIPLEKPLVAGTPGMTSGQIEVDIRDLGSGTCSTLADHSFYFIMTGRLD